MFENKKFFEMIAVEYTEKEGKREKKSKYYTRELLKKCGVKKYIELIFNYEFIAFKDLVHCSCFIPNINKKGESLFSQLDFSDNVYEYGRKKLVWYSEKFHKQKYGKDAKKVEINYELLDWYIPIIEASSDGSFLYVDKKNHRIVQLYSYSDENGKTCWEWAILAESFDEFIEKIYILPEDEKPISNEEKEELKRFVDKLLENIKKEED